MPDEIVVFLTNIRVLIQSNHCSFSNRIRNEKSYLEILFDDFGITVKEAWEQIKLLRKQDLCIDYRPNYDYNGKAYVFKRVVNGVLAYIKIKIEVAHTGEEVVCISFHKDE